MLKPLYDKIVVRRKEANEKSAGGLIIPENAKEQPREGIVEAVGCGLRLQDGTLCEMKIRVGDVVLFTSYGGTEVEVNGETLLIMSENDVLATIVE